MARTAVSDAEVREALAAALEQEIESLTARGVRISGNALSQIVLVKGQLNEAEQAGGELLSGADGTALRATLARLGYPPEDFCALAAVTGPADPAIADTLPAGEPVTPELFRETLETLDPEAVILLDDTARDVMREAYADPLSDIEDFNTAMLMPGLVAHVLGRRVLALDGFEAALSDKHEKQRMWAYLKQLPVAGAPY